MISSETQKLVTDPYVKMYIFDLVKLGGPTLRFTEAKNGPIEFDGETYSPTEIELSGFEINAESSPSSPTVNISTLDTPVAGYLDLYDDCIGAELYRIRTFAKYLDGGSSADPSQTLPVDKFIIERLARQDNAGVEFELRSMLNFDGMSFPRRRIYRNACDYIYRRPVYNEATSQWEFDYSRATCPYDGASSFTASGSSTTTQFDVCGKRLTDCRARFGTGVLPFRGFPGVRRNR